MQIINCQQNQESQSKKSPSKAQQIISQTLQVEVQSSRNQDMVQKSKLKQTGSFAESNYSQTSQSSSKIGKLQRGGGLTMQGVEFLKRNSKRIGLNFDMIGDTSTQASKRGNFQSRQQCQTARNINMTPMYDQKSDGLKQTTPKDYERKAYKFDFS